MKDILKVEIYIKGGSLVKNNGISNWMTILSIIQKQAEERDDLFIIGTHLGIYNFQNLLTNANVAINENDTGLELELYMRFSYVTRNIAVRNSWDFNDQEKKNIIKEIFEGNKTEKVISTMNNMEIAFVLCRICLKTGDYFLNKNLKKLS